MPEQKLYQKIGLSLRFAIFVLSLTFSIFQCQHPLSSNSSGRRQLHPSGGIGSFQVSHHGNYALLHGFKDPISQKNIPLLFDTGSEVSFLAEEEFPSSRNLEWGDVPYFFSVKKGILPSGIYGVIGLDFFRLHCIWWEAESLSVYQWQSEVCQKPEAYFTVGLKAIETKKMGSFYYIQYTSPKLIKHWGLVDSGASLSILPEEFEVGAESRGKTKLFLAGGLIQEVNLFFSNGKIEFLTKSGNTIPYTRFSFLRGISLEHLHLPREKDREDDSVIGLELLSRAPVFWDFKRNRIGIYSVESNSSEY
ncbi:MAG: hypothetical protein O9264_04675 [Leptospira sp.]|nr:hypothetical protein [Leptospira sp.]